ncbi:MAG: dockerin type I repeat-containing protein, partial [Planctomycetia bacterium]
YYPQWVDNTVAYLEDSANEDVNVIMWSWCGQVDSKYADGKLYSDYLTPMSELEDAYQDVTFVYMTGHVDHWDDVNNKLANQEIRNYCIENDKVLFDFADIECYDPDGTFYEFPHDNCDYYESLNGSKLGNWATEWQNSHTEGVDWYSCSSAHSQPLNANQKAYAAWRMFFEIAAEMTMPEHICDLNRDGKVDASDATILAGNWQYGADMAEPDATWTMGDFNGDGVVDASDATILAADWGQGGVVSSTVPEPSMLLLLLGLAGFWLCRRVR